MALRLVTIGKDHTMVLNHKEMENTSMMWRWNNMSENGAGASQ